MAYVPGCDHDVFISYSQLNNIPAVGVPKGWVTYFTEEFKSKLLMQENIANPDVFIDYQSLNNGDILTRSIYEAIKKSAVLIIIMSQKYLRSGWCEREREEFMRIKEEFYQLVKKRSNSGSTIESSLSRIIIVEYDEIPGIDRPKELEDILANTKFWKRDDQNRLTILGDPQPDPIEKEYYKNIRRLSEVVAQKLSALKSLADKGLHIDDDENTIIEEKWNKEDQQIDGCCTQPGNGNPSDFTVVLDAYDLDEDRQIMRRLQESALAHGLGYKVIRRSSKSASFNRKEFCEKIKICGSCIIVNADGDGKSISARVKAFEKALALREKPMSNKGRAIIEAPPLPRPLPDDMPPHMMYIYYEDDFPQEKVDRFFKELKNDLRK